MKILKIESKKKIGRETKRGGCLFIYIFTFLVFLDEVNEDGEEMQTY